MHSPIPQEKQDNNKKTVGVEVGGNKKEKWTKFEKGGRGGQYRGIFHEIGGLGTLCQICI